MFRAKIQQHFEHFAWKKIIYKVNELKHRKYPVLSSETFKNELSFAAEQPIKNKIFYTNTLICLG